MRLLMAVRTAAVAVLASLAIAGCGGGGGGGSSASYNVSVNVSGLSGTVVVAMGSSMLTFNADGTGTFGAMLPAGSTYNVTVSTQPANQYCAVPNGVGAISADITVDVSCNASSGGIWQGTSTDGNDQYVAMADESGDFWLLDYDNDNNPPTFEYLYIGTLSVSGAGAGASVSGSDGGQALVGTFSDGTSNGTGTLSGTVDPRTTLTLTQTFTTAPNGTQLQTPLTLTYNALYTQVSSLANMAGTYTEPLNEQGTQAVLTVSISTSGAIFAQANVGGCVLNGTVSTLASNYNMYYLQYTYSECTNASGLAYLNGLSFSGIGTLQPGDSSANPAIPAQIIAGTRAPLTTGYLYATVDWSSSN